MLIRNITFCNITHFSPPSAQPVEERSVGQPVLTVQERLLGQISSRDVGLVARRDETKKNVQKCVSTRDIRKFYTL